MPLIAHLSDPHFGTERPYAAEALIELLSGLKIDLAIISGDLTQRARTGQFLKMKAFMEKIKAERTLIIPGNHDIPLFDLFSRLFFPYNLYREVLGASLEPVFSNANILAIGVNTTRRYRHKQGSVSPAQIQRVSELLEQATPTQLRLVVTHQPVWVLRNADRDNRLRGACAAIQAWAEAGADLILGGHIHLPYTVSLLNKLPALKRPVWAVQAGTAVSERVRNGAGNSINLIRYENRLTPCLVERWDYYPDNLNFVKLQTFELQLAL